jgi:prepilin-type N-terminal cleavage/methylation domain-containing protein
MKKAFTLVELLVVISIVSLLSSTIYSNLSDARQLAVDTASIQEAKAVESALFSYYMDKETYPGVTAGSFNEGTIGYEALQELVSDGYISKIPESADGESFTYVRPGSSLDRALFLYKTRYEKSLSNHSDFTNVLNQVVTEFNAKWDPGNCGGSTCTQDDFRSDMNLLVTGEHTSYVVPTIDCTEPHNSGFTYVDDTYVLVQDSDLNETLCHFAFDDICIAENNNCDITEGVKN